MCPDIELVLFIGNFVFGMISLLFYGVIAYLYLRDLHLSTPPGKLIASMHIMKIIYWMTFVLDFSSLETSFKDNTYSACTIMRCVTAYADICIWGYCLAFNIEIRLRITRPYLRNYFVPSRVYHCVVHSLGITAVIINLSGSQNTWNVDQGCAYSSSGLK